MLNLIDNFIINEGTPNESKLDLAITQGKTYVLNFFYPGNLLNGELKGEIRNNFLRDGGEILASFSFNVSYDPIETEDNIIVYKSNVKCIISANNTSLIPYTKFQNPLLSQISIKNAWVYDIEYKENETIIELLRGFVQVKAEVTD